MTYLGGYCSFYPEISAPCLVNVKFKNNLCVHTDRPQLIFKGLLALLWEGFIFFVLWNRANGRDLLHNYRMGVGEVRWTLIFWCMIVSDFYAFFFFFFWYFRNQHCLTVHTNPCKKAPWHKGILLQLTVRAEEAYMLSYILILHGLYPLQDGHNCGVHAVLSSTQVSMMTSQSQHYFLLRPNTNSESFLTQCSIEQTRIH